MDEESSEQLVWQRNAVFSNEIILEVILINLRPDSVHEILQLRLVSKLWHKVTFKVFRRLAIIPINVNFKQWSYPSFRFNISSQCNLPIGVVITNLVLKPKELNFFKSFSKHIVQVYFEEVEENDKDGRKPFPTDLYKLHLPKLETVKVTLPQFSNIYYSRQSSAFKLVETFLQSTKKLKTFELVENKWDWKVKSSLLRQADFPTNHEVPSDVTSLQWVSYSESKYLNDCLLEAQLPNLQNLQIGFTEEFDDESPSFEQVVNKFSSSLVELVVKENSVNLIKLAPIWQLSVNSQMKHLRSLELYNVHLQSGFTPWSELLPELRNVYISNCNTGRAYETLNVLGGNGLEEFPKMNSLTIKVICGDENFQAPTERVLKPFRTVTRLCLGRHVPEFLIEILPCVFMNLTGLEYLQIQIRPEGNDMGITKLLTGVKEEEIPAEESLWNGMLEGNVHSINNLKRLRAVQIDVSYGNCRRFMSGFAFAALLMIPHLKRLELVGYHLMMDQKYERKWIESNRHIYLVNSSWELKKSLKDLNFQTITIY